MGRCRTMLAMLAAGALGTFAALLMTVGSSAAPTKSQELFAKALLDDPRTASQIRELLADGGGIVAPDITFADLTGDGRSDAIVLVDTRGAAGAVALYVFSTHGAPADSDLRAVYRSQRLYRARVAVSDGTLVLRTPRYGEGDDVCCPARVVSRVYAWSKGRKTMTLRSSRELPGPAG